MKLWPVALFGWVAYVIQTSLLDWATIWGVRPDLVLLTICIVAMRRGPAVGAATGLIAGLLIDLAGGRMIGMGALARAAAGTVVGWSGRNLFGENALAYVVMVLLGSAVEQMIFLTGTWAFGIPFPFVDGLVRVALPSLWYDGVAATLLYPLFKLVDRRVGLFRASDDT